MMTWAGYVNLNVNTMRFTHQHIYVTNQTNKDRRITQGSLGRYLLGCNVTNNTTTRVKYNRYTVA